MGFSSTKANVGWLMFQRICPFPASLTGTTMITTKSSHAISRYYWIKENKVIWADRQAQNITHTKRKQRKSKSFFEKLKALF